MSDSMIFWLSSNLILLWPLVYKKKRVEIDNFIGFVNLKINEKLDGIHILKKLEKPKKEESKKE